MKRRLPLLALLAAVFQLQAHRLDECLQATRVKVATNRVDVSMDITPGADMAGQFLLFVDKNQDGRVSDDEAGVYARAVLKALPVDMDKRPVGLALMEVSFPTVGRIRSGEGVVRIQAFGTFARLLPGLHQLSLTNQHLDTVSVYLVNALKPADGAIVVRKQSRDSRQKEYRLEFSVEPLSHENTPEDQL